MASDNKTRLQRTIESKQGRPLFTDAKDDRFISFGKYAGKQWTQVPLNYIKFLVKNKAYDMHLAEKEMNRRGASIDDDDMDLSGHAINRASQYCLDLWQKQRKGGEGLHAWLLKNAKQAFKHRPANKEKIPHNQMLFVFQSEGIGATLLTVIRDNNYK